MADLAYIKTSKVTLPDIPIIGGQVIRAADVNETYYDSSNGIRVKFDNVVYLYTEQDRQNYVNPKSGTLYVVEHTSKMYKYIIEAGWLRLYTMSDMYDIIDTVDELVPSTISRDGVKIAPKTLATEVYTIQGERVEDKLKTISKLGTVTAYTPITADNQTVFDIPIPFENYFELGNYVQVFVGSVLFDERRYSIKDNKLNLYNAEEQLSSAREITFVFWFNSTTPPSNVTYAINGSYILDKSIPTRKLAGVYNGLDIANPDLLASSLALSTAYVTLTEKINSIAGNLVAHAMSFGDNGKELKATIPNFTLVDNSTIYLRLHAPIESGATLSVNGGTAFPIYMNYKTPIKSGLAKDDVINITYSALSNKFYVNASVAYRLQHYKYEYIAVGGETEITIDISEYDPNYDELIVHQNSIRLVERTHYVISGRKIILVGYNASPDDLFLFEIDKVRGNGLPIDGNTIMKELVFTEKVFFKDGIDITGDLDINGNINLNGELHFSGGASSGSNFTAEQFISTALAPLPPIVCKSSALVENLNADMVDGYHADDLVRPDNSIEFVIDGETDVLDPDLQIQFNSFYGRVEALKDRMVLRDNADRPTANKRRITDSFPDSSIDPDDYMYNSVVQDTVEDIVWRIDNLRYQMMGTQECEYNIADLNGMTGDEIREGTHLDPVYMPFYNNIAEMNKAIDDELYDIEAKMIMTVDDDYVEPETYTELMRALRSINDTPVTKSYSEVPTVMTRGSSQKNATRAKYVITGGERVYPITHKNAVIGLPNAEIATIRHIEALQQTIKDLTSRIQTLEGITGGGVTGKSFLYVNQ